MESLPHMKVRTLALILSGLFATLACLLVVDYILETAVLMDDAIKARGTNVLCQHTVGKVYVADSLGSVCKWQEVDYKTGCCPTTDDSGTASHCAQNCCSDYAFCVSSCLKQNNPPIPSTFKSSSTQSLLSGLSTKKKEDKYQYCLYTCRTDSKSVINENQFMSEYKYCFSHQPLGHGFVQSTASIKPNVYEESEEQVKKENTEPDAGNDVPISETATETGTGTVDESSGEGEKLEDFGKKDNSNSKEAKVRTDEENKRPERDLGKELEEKTRQLEQLSEKNKRLEEERRMLEELLREVKASKDGKKYEGDATEEDNSDYDDKEKDSKAQLAKTAVEEKDNLFIDEFEDDEFSISSAASPSTSGAIMLTVFGNLLLKLRY